MKSIQPRKQRRALYNAPIHKKRKWLASHLAENLLLKYDKRSMPIIKGDTVKVMRGSFKGHEDKIANVNVKRGFIQIEGITLVKADGKKIAKPIHPSSVMITKLNLTDKWRRNKLERGLSEDVKKEIEHEAAEQLKEQEEEQKRLEKEAEEAAALEETAEEPIEPEIKKETPEEPKEKTPVKAPSPKPSKPKKTTSPPKKKAPSPKKSTKKPPTKKKTAPKSPEAKK